MNPDMTQGSRNQKYVIRIQIFWCLSMLNDPCVLDYLYDCSSWQILEAPYQTQPLYLVQINPLFISGTHIEDKTEGRCSIHIYQKTQIFGDFSESGMRQIQLSLYNQIQIIAVMFTLLTLIFFCIFEQICCAALPLVSLIKFNCSPWTATAIHLWY